MRQAIQPLNYCTHAIEELSRLCQTWPVNGKEPQLPRFLEHGISTLKKAEKFMLPENADFMDLREMKPHFLDLFRLPFPVIALEVPTATRERRGQGAPGPVIIPRRIVTAEADPTGRLLYVMHFGYASVPSRGIEDSSWMLGDMSLTFNLDEAKVLDTGNVTGMRFFRHVALPVGGEQDAIDDCMFPMEILTKFLLTVNCENVKQQVIAAPDKLNKKRRASGSAPLYSFRVLTLPLPAYERHEHHGTHATPRLHLRRGHLRRLQTGKVLWVRHCMVGNPDRGVVEKEYAIGA